MEGGGNIGAVDEAPVYPETDARSALRRFDVDVGCAIARRLVDKAVYKPDDRRGSGLRFAYVAAFFARGGKFRRGARLRLARAAPDSVIGHRGALQVAARRGAYRRLAPGDQPYFVGGLHVERGCHRDGNLPVLRHGERHDAEPRRRTFRNERKRLFRRPDFAERQKRDAKL